MDPRTHFSDEDLENIRQATRSAEGRTSGEIVPVVVGTCDEYDETIWKAATLGGLFAALSAAVFHTATGLWGGGPVWLTLPAIGGCAVAAFIAYSSSAVRRALIPASVLESRVEQRARQAFLEEEVFATRDRSGILIFLALFERRVVVIGDEAINRAVEQSEWNEVVEHLVAGIRTGKPGPALVEAITECGRLLELRGVEIKPDDTDELHDGLRMEER